MKESYTSKKRVRKNFGRIDAVADMPSLIEIQKGSYDSFIQANGAEKCEFGLDEVFKSISRLKISPATVNLSSLNMNLKSRNMTLKNVSNAI